jgi:hypothetical protein
MPTSKPGAADEIEGQKGLNSRFKRCFLDCRFHDGFGHLAAFATLGGNTKLTPHVGKRTSTTGD